MKKIIFTFVLVMNNNKPDISDILKKCAVVGLVIGSGMLLVKLCVDYHMARSEEFRETIIETIKNPGDNGKKIKQDKVAQK